MSATGEDPFLALLEADPEQLYETAPCGYLTTTADGTICRANRTFLAMTGYDAAELVGRRRFADLLSMGGRIYHETHYAPMLHMSGTAREIALDLVHRDGRAVPVLVSAVADRAPDGGVQAVRVALFEAAHRRQYERELVRAKERAEASEARARMLARTLQRTLIPPAPPLIPHLDVATRYRPAGDGTEVGGDFYDVFRVGGGDWVVIIGDVRGKGAEAAVVTALARYTLRAAAMEHPSPAESLRRLNENMLQSGTDRFCTVAMLRLSRVAGKWEGVLSSAGHPLPLLRSRDGGVRPVGRTGTLAGVLPEPTLRDTSISLTPGAALVLYTDGLPEARRGPETFGDERIRSIASGTRGSAAALADALLTAALEYQGDTARDDIAIVVLRGE